MTAEEFQRRLTAFALREGMTFATLIGLPPLARTIAVATMIAGLDAGASYAERDVNIRLQRWLDGVGANVETDRANLRRWLVDTGVMSRNADCSDYRLAAFADGRMLALARSIDCEGLTSKARLARSSERAQRKAAWVG